MSRRRSRHGGWAWLAVVAVAVAFLVVRQKAPALLGQPFGTVSLLLTAEPGLPVPVDGVARRQIVDTWGDPRSRGRRHEGLDIFAPRGTPVRSTTEGVVVRVGVVSLGGRTVTVVGPRLTRHYYAHLERFGAVAVGDRVEAGDVVGYVGDSGNARGTPCHLHYGVYRALVWPANPWPLLDDAEPPARRSAGGWRRPR